MYPPISTAKMHGILLFRPDDAWTLNEYQTNMFNNCHEMD